MGLEVRGSLQMIVYFPMVDYFISLMDDRTFLSFQRCWLYKCVLTLKFFFSKKSWVVYILCVDFALHIHVPIFFKVFFARPKPSSNFYITLAPS